MKKFMKRPAIVFAIIFAIIFVIMLIESILLDALSKANTTNSNVDEEKISEYEQELESLIQPDESKFVESTEKKTEITLGYRRYF